MGGTKGDRSQRGTISFISRLLIGVAFAAPTISPPVRPSFSCSCPRLLLLILLLLLFSAVRLNTGAKSSPSTSHRRTRQVFSRTFPSNTHCSRSPDHMEGTSQALDASTNPPLVPSSEPSSAILRSSNHGILY